jgi:beta-lactamase class A
MKGKVWSTAGIVTALVLGVLLGYVAHDLGDAAHNANTGRQVREGGGTFTNPLLECEVASGTLDGPKARFGRELTEYAAEISKRPGITDIGVYYRDLNNGPTYGVGEDKEFAPASLLKVPVYLAFLKHAESDRSILSKQITFSENMTPTDANQIIQPELHLQPGTTYTVSELLTRMIKYSDNDALNVLYPLLPEKEYVDLFNRLGLTDFSPANSGYTLSVKEYSTFFRVLFNASFLSQASSEEALRELSETTFASGIVAGVPKNVQVSHKFGERELGDGFMQLHDCGIVYPDKRPYLICIMTRGTSQDAITKAISDISSFAYQKSVE